MNPNWQETDQLAIYTMQWRSWTPDYQEQIQIAVGRMVDLSQGHSNFKSSILTLYLAMLFCFKIQSTNMTYLQVAKLI